MKRIRKRISCFILALGLTVLPLLTAMIPKTEVKAAAGVLGLDQSIEIMKILYSALASGLFVGGAVNADFTDADTCGAAFCAFMDGLCESVGLGNSTAKYLAENSTFTLADGSVVTLENFLNSYETFEGVAAGAEDLAPSALGKYGITKSKFKNWTVKNGGSSGENPEPPKSPVSAFTIAAGFFGKICSFASDLWDGNIPNLNPNDYFDKNNFGDYTYENYKFYVIQKVYATDGTLRTTTVNYEAYKYGLVYQFNTNDLDRYYIMRLRDDNEIKKTELMATISDGTKGKVYEFMNGYEYNQYAKKYGGKYFIETNLPIFRSESAMRAYYENNDNSGITNKPKVNVNDLNNNVENALSGLEGKQLQPDAMINTYQAVKTAYDTQVAPAIESNPQADPADNTNLYNEAVADAVADIIPAVTQPEPEPEPEKEPSRLPEHVPIPFPDSNPLNLPDSPSVQNPNADEEAIKAKFGNSSPSVDLTGIFPFCIPFDFIHLLDAIEAEPITPEFTFPFVVPALGINKEYVISLKWLDAVMEVVRTFEIVGFLIFLMSQTGKFIKW